MQVIIHLRFLFKFWIVCGNTTCKFHLLYQLEFWKVRSYQSNCHIEKRRLPWTNVICNIVHRSFILNMALGVLYQHGVNYLLKIQDNYNCVCVLKSYDINSRTSDAAIVIRMACFVFFYLPSMPSLASSRQPPQINVLQRFSQHYVL